MEWRNNQATSIFYKSASLSFVLATINLESSSKISVNLIYSLFLCSTLLLDRLALSSPLQPSSVSRSLANSLSSEISQNFLSFPILLTNFLWIASYLWMKYRLMLSIFEYVSINLLRCELPGFRLWFCLIRYCPKNKHGLKRLLTSGSICSVLSMSCSSYLERAIMPSVRVGISFSTR